MRLRNGESVTPGGPQDLPAEVFFLTYKKEKPINSFISNLLNSDDDMIFNNGNGDNYNLLSLLRFAWQIVNSYHNSNSNHNDNDNSSYDGMMNNGIESFYNPIKGMEYRGGKGKASNGPDIYF